MSLDLDTRQKKGYTKTTADIINNAFPAAGDFPAGEVDTSNKLVATYDTGAGPITVTPAAIVGVEEGDKLQLVKISTDTNAITITDAVTGITHSFVDREGEFYSLTWTGADWTLI